MVKLRSFDEWGDEWVKTIIPPTQFFIDGTNPTPRGTERYEVGKYDINEIDTIILDGGEIT